MSHLGEQISALVDGELNGAELDRANAHLATCEQCRAEAAELRQLKRELRALAAPPAAGKADGHASPAEAADALTRRLLAMAGPGGPVPSRGLRREQHARDRHHGKLPRGGRPPRGRTGMRASERPPADGQPYSRRRPGGTSGETRRRGRYMLWSAVSIVVVGIGAAAFSMGGSTAEPGPKITPQLEMFSVEHALTFGDVPFPDPTQVPAGATKP
ncbi:MAG TPA: zf-HC2 domain-containing protein [Trebonia sp.]|nr:zf-HC2 domain-containing protein [Trebonia sp.]